MIDGDQPVGFGDMTIGAQLVFAGADEASVVGVVAGVCSPPDFGMTVFCILFGGILG